MARLESALVSDSPKMSNGHWSQEFLLMFGSRSSARCWIPALFVAAGLVGVDWAQQSPKQSPTSQARLERTTVKEFVTQHCTSCHNNELKRGGLDLDAIG